MTLLPRLLLALPLAAAADLIRLDGSGTTNPSKFYWEIMSLFEARAVPPVKMTYRAVGSSTGQFEFAGADQGYAPFNDFGSGDMPFAAEARAALNAAGATFFHVPFCLGAMSFFHNVPGVPAGGLKVDACLLADIFSGVVTTWDHADVLAQNPDFAPPAAEPIVVYHRTKGSSTTKGVTQYLHAACPAKWAASQVGSKIEWPASTFAVQGSGGMSAAISATPYSIGYIDSGHGHDDGLAEIELRNAAGTYLSSTEAKAYGGVQAAAAEALATGVMPADPAADFSAVSLHNMPGEHTWPIVAISYLYLRQDQTARGATAALLYAFVEYVLSAAGQALLADYNFEAVPQAVMNVSTAALEALALPGDNQAWTFETDTVRGGGQEDYVISAKRRSHYEYALGELEAEMASVEALAALAARVDALGDKTCDCDGGGSDAATKTLATIALVLAAVAAALAAAALAKAAAAAPPAKALAPAGQESEICLPAIKPSAQAYADLTTGDGNRNV